MGLMGVCTTTYVSGTYVAMHVCHHTCVNATCVPSQVEHARRLRQLAEDEARLTAAQLELEREEAGLRAAAAAADAKRQAEGMTSW